VLARTSIPLEHVEDLGHCIVCSDLTASCLFRPLGSLAVRAARLAAAVSPALTAASFPRCGTFEQTAASWHGFQFGQPLDPVERRHPLSACPASPAVTPHRAGRPVSPLAAPIATCASRRDQGDRRTAGPRPCLKKMPASRGPFSNTTVGFGQGPAGRLPQRPKPLSHRTHGRTGRPARGRSSSADVNLAQRDPVQSAPRRSAVFSLDVLHPGAEGRPPQG